MPLFESASGKLGKMKIFSFLDIDAQKINFTAPNGYYEAQFNPESFTVNQTISYCESEKLGNVDSVQRYVRIPSKSFSFTFLFEGTGASGKKVMVPAEIARFMQVTHNYVGVSHRPPFLILQWGTFVEKCVLSSANVTYELLSESGVPLRAKINATFKTAESERLADLFRKNNSPDLTHVRIVKEGDTLPLLCREIYGVENHYLKVAKVNRLMNYRKLTPGQELYFPPLQTEA